MALIIEEPAWKIPRPDDAQGTVLDSQEADRYIRTLIRAIRAARVNALFPPEPALCAHLSFLGPAGSRGLYRELHVAQASGLPSAKEIYRVKMDRELAEGLVREERAGGDASGGEDLRLAYFQALAQSDVMPLARMRLELRHIDGNMGYFRVVFDRFDLAGQQFVRYTVLLAQRDRMWKRMPAVVDDAELAKPTEGIRDAIARLAADDAEAAFVRLSAAASITVEDVCRGRIGPLLTRGANLPDPVAALLDPACTPELGEEARWILCVPEERAGIHVAAHGGGDPLALPRDADAGASASRAAFGQRDSIPNYRVARRRKLVCPAPLAAPLTEICRALGAPSIVQAVSL